MVFLVKVPYVIVSVTSQFFRANEVRFEQVFDNLTFKRTDPLRKRFRLSSILFCASFLGKCNIKQILTMIKRIKLVQRHHMVCFDISERYDIG